VDSFSSQLESTARRLAIYVAAGFVLTFMLVGGLVLHGVWQQHRVLDDIEALLELRARKITLASNIEALSRRRSQILFAQLLSAEKSERESLMGQYLETTDRFEKTIGEFSALPQDGADLADIQRLRSIETRHDELNEQALTLNSQGERELALGLLRDKAMILQEAEAEVIDSIRTHQQSRMAEQSRTTRAQARVAMWVSGALGAAACVLIGFVFFAVRWLLRERSKSVNQKAKEIEALSDQLFIEATRDPLTGLANRRMFFQELERAVERANSQRTSLALGYIDLDHFKPINDEHGHAAGDALLRTIAERMLASARRGDVIARLGGDEFAVIAENIDRAGAETLEAALRNAIAADVSLGDVVVQPQMSIGWAHLPEAGRSAGELLHFADDVMYAQKAERKGQARVRQKDSFKLRESRAGSGSADSN
jgi:diguanylate cyclase (GGDEF)-like protein